MKWTHRHIREDLRTYSAHSIRVLSSLISSIFVCFFFILSFFRSLFFTQLLFGTLDIWFNYTFQAVSWIKYEKNSTTIRSSKSSSLELRCFQFVLFFTYSTQCVRAFFFSIYIFVLSTYGFFFVSFSIYSFDYDFSCLCGSCSFLCVFYLAWTWFWST